MSVSNNNTILALEKTTKNASTKGQHVRRGVTETASAFVTFDIQYLGNDDKEKRS